MSTILIVEDEQPIRQMVGFTLKRENYTLLEAENCTQAKQIISQNPPDLILMDRMLPDKDGVDFTRYLKRQINTQNIPIIMLTARTEEADKIEGLNAGSDDYISKPFSTGELVARIQAVLRRTSPATQVQNQLSCHDLTLDPSSHRVFIKDDSIDLGPTEFRLLKFFMQHPERVYSREQLLDHAWGQNVYVEERTVDVHILRLRKTLAPWGYDSYIQTVRGAGYRFSTKVNK